MDALGRTYLEGLLGELEALASDDDRRWLIVARGSGAAQALEWAGLLDQGEHQIWMGQLKSVANGRGRIDLNAPRSSHAQHDLVRAARERLEHGEAERLPPEPVWRPERYLICDPDAGDPAVNLIEIRSGVISFRIRHEDQTEPIAGQPPMDSFFAASDDAGTEYRCGLSQSGGIVTCHASPAPPATARHLRLATTDGDDRSFDLTETVSGDESNGRIEYRAETDVPVVGARVAVERFCLALQAVSHFPLTYAESGIRALDELGLLEAEDVKRALEQARNAAAHKRPAMNRVRRPLYPDPPEWAGVRVGGVILFDDAVSIRWGQLPPEFRPGGPEPWLLLDYNWRPVNWTLADDLGTIYHPVNLADGHGGFFSYPYWTGERAFVPGVPDQARELRITVEQHTVVLHLAPRALP